MSATNDEINDKLLTSMEAINSGKDAPSAAPEAKLVEEEKHSQPTNISQVEEEEEFELSPKDRERNTLKRFTKVGAVREIREFDFGLPRSVEEGKARDVFAKNEISTAKYTSLTFFPRNLFEQITKPANTYFLLLSILQCIPAISITDGKPTVLVPLSIVILVSMIKDFIEDRKRQKSDKVENNSKVLILQSSGEFETKRWADIRVGDIVKIRRDTPFPADLVLLNSSSAKGICYVETKNLDGETNLKYKIARKETVDLLKDESAIKGFHGSLLCELPNPALYNFEGALNIDEGTLVPLSAEQLLLRGSTLKNTDYVYGLVIYTGPESKIQMNSSKARTKRSIIEGMTHKQIMLIFIMQLVISFTCGIGGMFWLAIHYDSAKGFLELDMHRLEDSSWYTLFKLFSSWLLMTVQLVPLSLLITLEVIRYLQAMYIGWDADMYDPDTQIPPSVQSSNLNEELGQVSYIFSDKTGTLTCNIMEFKKLAIGKMRFGSSSANMEPVPGVTNVNFVSPEMMKLLQDPKQSKKHLKVSHIGLFLALCHTVLVEEKKEGKALNSASPDELALVNAAKYFGFEFVGRDENGAIMILHNGEVIIYPLLNVLEFNSNRKRMSVIVKMPDGKILLLCKGADNMIYERLSHLSKYKDSVQQFLLDCGNEGLRTLALAEKEISEAEYEEWNKGYQEAVRSVYGREKKLDAEAEKIETDMMLLGATAIEDKLQDQVGETIDFIKQAGVKFWVLTGDKVETAINIAYSCQLLTSNSIKMIVDSKDSSSVYEKLTEIEAKLASFKSALHKLARFALIITGDSLIKAMAHKDITSVFTKICKVAPVVIACRVSPKQKAEIVNLVRKNDKSSVTLSIGDGANDVNMITAAHVGVGIRGLEGQQASRASDYAITKFKHLKNLLFVHGREATRRNAYTICYSFYKNILLVVPGVVFALWSAGSAQSLYNEWLYQLYNTIFTSVPIVYFAVLDKEHEREEFLADPTLYKASRKGEYFSYTVFWRWMGYGFLQSAFLLIITLHTLANNPSGPHGILEDIHFIGNLVFTLIVIVANLKIAVSHNTHTVGSTIFIVGSIAVYYFFYYLISLGKSYSIYGSFGRLFFNWVHLFLQLLLVVSLMLMEVVLSQAKAMLYEYYHAIKQKIFYKSSMAEEPSAVSRSMFQENVTFNIDTGFAFSQDPGQTPQLTSPEFKAMAEPQLAVSFNLTYQFTELWTIIILSILCK
eukprot:TRINITY_DN1507_c0_g1_i1.p1 TRINITY_DN1507_c0_g1~~TRINITY_DN1507_c0_g1_i1.p1  ORF type:complete len:1220 (+),score=110.17 TRINITY_DN1507_c0_g1_i1:124-3783(+)